MNVFVFVFCPSHSLSSHFRLSPSLVVTQIRGHKVGSSPSSPTTVLVLHFYREKISALSSLVDVRRIPPTHATKALSAIGSFFIFSNNVKISPRWDSNWVPMIVAFEADHYSTGATGMNSSIAL